MEARKGRGARKDGSRGGGASGGAPPAPEPAIDYSMHVDIAAPPARVWETLTADINRWWDPGFLTIPGSRGFLAEWRPGGLVVERGPEGDDGLVWFLVLGVRRERSLLLAGDLSPSFGGPARLLTEFRLEERDRGTRVTLRETAHGAAGAATRRSLEEGWTHLLGDRLKRAVENPGMTL